MKNNKGFSIVELVVTMAVAAILTTGIIVAIRMNTGWKVNKATELLDSALNKAMVSAMSKGSTAGLIIYKADGVCYAAIISDSCESGGTYTVTEDKVQQKIELGGDSLTITCSYMATDGSTVAPLTLTDQSSETNMNSAAQFLFARSTGALKNVTVSGKESYYTKITIANGTKTRSIKIYAATGRHEIE